MRWWCVTWPGKLRSSHHVQEVYGKSVARRTLGEPLRQIRLLLLAILLIVPAGAANWERWSHSGKGYGGSIAEPHPLSYFTQYPSLRDSSFCYLCPPEKRLALAKQEKLNEKQRTEMRLVGTVHGFKIYDVIYYFSRRSGNSEYHDDETPEWKSILVRTGPNQYREIWFDQKTQGDFSPSFLFQVGDKTLLGLIDDCYRRYCEQQYWLFVKDGPTRLDLEPIWKAASTLVPKNQYLRYYDYRDTPAILGQEFIEFGLEEQLPDRGGPPVPVPGVIKVNFTWDRGQIVITGKEYDSTAR